MPTLKTFSSLREALAAQQEATRKTVEELNKTPSLIAQYKAPPNPAISQWRGSDAHEARTG